MARRLMIDLAGRIDFPSPHGTENDADQRRSLQPVVQIPTDGFAAYREAIDLAFGGFASHGVIIKEYRNASMNYTPSQMVGTDRRVIRGGIDGFSIFTSHIERHNLTVRTFMKRLTPLSPGFSKSFEHHAAAIAMFLAYYNFVWRTRCPDQSGKSGRNRPPPAMMAGIVDKLWSFQISTATSYSMKNNEPQNSEDRIAELEKRVGELDGRWRQDGCMVHGCLIVTALLLTAGAVTIYVLYCAVADLEAQL